MTRDYRHTPLPPVIIFGGFENALPLVRTFGTRSIAVYVLVEPHSEVKYSRYARAIRLPENAPYLQSALAFLTSSASDHLLGSVLLVAGDEELGAVADHRRVLSQRFRLDVSNSDAQRMMLNKLDTYEAARQAGVPTPQFWQVQSDDDLYRLRDEFVYPLIVKPKLSHEFQRKFKAKFILVEDFPQLLDGYHQVEKEGIDTLLVEMIPGPDSKLCSYYTYMDEAGDALFDFTKRVIRRYPTNMGLASYHITDRVEQVRELSLRLFRHVGLQGLANAEFKYDERDKQLKLIECNARFTAANALVARAGFDLGLFVYNGIVGIPRPVLTDFRVGLRQWDPTRDVLAFRELNKRGELTLIQWLSSIMHWHSYAYFSWRDPLPSLVRLTKRIRNIRPVAQQQPTRVASRAEVLAES